MHRIAGFLLLLCAHPATADLFGPDSYEECLEQYLEPGQGVFAAQLLRTACDTEFLRPDTLTPRQKNYIDCLREALQDDASNRAAQLANFTCGKNHLKYIP